jgi:hypothetical protein
MRTERCETCRFWAVLPDDEQHLPPLSLVSNLGACHRGLIGGSEGETWPRREYCDWCGEWKPTPSQEAHSPAAERS